MKEICKNCLHCKPSYKHSVCEDKNGARVRLTETCENWRPKK